MKCTEVRENMAALLDGELDGAPRRAMDEHLAVCAPCAAERRAQAAAWRLLDLAGPSSLPAGFTEKVVARARAEGDSPGSNLLRLVPLPAAAAAAVILAVGGVALFVHSRGRPGDAAPAEAPPEQLLDNLAVLESMDVLEDGDLDALDKVTDLGDEDLAVLGG